MNSKLRAVLFLSLVVVAALMAWGAKLNWLVYGTVICVIALIALLYGFDSKADPRRISLVGALIAITVASRQLLHGVEFSPVFCIVITAGRIFGFTTGFAVGALSMFVSNFFLGQGPWTPYQMLGMGLTGALASVLPIPRRYETVVLTVYSVMMAYAYGLITDLFFWMSFIPTHTITSFVGLASAGMLANTTRAVGNVFFFAILGPALLRIFRRFNKRLTG
jgi:energy-coupling factor transport system substrate-specific component